MRRAPEERAPPSPLLLSSPPGLTRGSIPPPHERSPWMPGSSPGMTTERRQTTSSSLLLHADRPQRMVGVRIGMMVMSMVMSMMVVAVTVVVIMIVAVMVIIIMVMPVMVMVMIRLSGADALHVMVVALLGQAHFRLEAQYLCAVLAELAVHQVLAVEDLLHPLGESVQHQGMVVEVAGFHELDLRVARRDQVGVVVDALHQDAGEEEVGE